MEAGKEQLSQENSKSEIRNPKQIPDNKSSNPKQEPETLPSSDPLGI